MSADKSGLPTEQAPPGIDTSKAHPARRYNYWLGGKDNYKADRESGDAIAANFPTVRLLARENRRFLRRAIRHLAREAGVRQFLDIGTGIPTAENTHEVAQAIAPESRIVYVDNDPLVLVHARALLTSAPEGATAYLQADLREPDKILEHPDLKSTLDLSRPMALMLIAVLHFLLDSDDPYGTVGRLVEALPSGSYLVITHAAPDYLSQEQLDSVPGHNQRSTTSIQLRDHKQVGRFFDGLELVSPGIISPVEWRPEDPPEIRPSAAEIATWAGVARIP